MPKISKALCRYLLELDAELKDPLTVLKFTAEALAADPRPCTTRKQKLLLILQQVERMCAVLKKMTTEIQGERRI